MSDRPDNGDNEKIVSLDQRRRDDAARQKAEVAAAAKLAANGSQRSQSQPWGRPTSQGGARPALQSGPRRAANDGGATPIATGIGTVLGWLVWIVLGVTLALMAWSMLTGSEPTRRPEIPAEQLQTV